MARFTQSDKMEALAAVPLFSGLTKRQLREVARNCMVISLPKGELVTEEATMGREAFLILQGRATVLRDGKRVATLNAGDIVGEMSLLDRLPRSATCKVTEDSALLVMSSREFSALLESVPAIAKRLLVTLSERLRAADTKLIP